MGSVIGRYANTLTPRGNMVEHRLLELFGREPEVSFLEEIDYTRSESCLKGSEVA